MATRVPASARRCFCPPDSAVVGWSSGSSRPVRASASRTRGQIRDLQRHLGITTLYVTDDLTEAAELGDRVAEMVAGRLVRCAPPTGVR